MRRRNFIAGAPLSATGWSSSVASEGGPARIQLPESPHPGPFREVVLFGFDDWAFPFQNNVQKHLIPGVRPRVVLRHGPAGSHDEVLLYYGTVIRIGDRFHMWYTGNYGPQQNQIGYERVNCCVCYATSSDGVAWEKPDLGLVEFGGSKRNNIVDLPDPRIWSTCALLHDPEDPDPARRYKMAYEAGVPGSLRFSVAFSPDGLRWKPSPKNPVAPFLEMAGIAKFRGRYYVNGQGGLAAHRLLAARRLVTFVSSDFETWSPAGAVGLERSPDLTGPSGEDRMHQFEEIHLGAAMWNRGNVMLGIYGQWHGHPSGDRRLVAMDLGLALTHDAIHFHEPLPNFRFIPAREQPESPSTVAPALMQGQGMENVGDQTLYWYSLWRGTPGSGVRLVTWGRDRLGMLKPFRATDAQTVSCLIEAGPGANAFVNASGIGANSRLRVDLLDPGFHPVAGYSGDGAVLVTESGFRAPLRWKAGGKLPPSPVRLAIRFEGTRPEDASLHAVYVAEG